MAICYNLTAMDPLLDDDVNAASGSQTKKQQLIDLTKPYTKVVKPSEDDKIEINYTEMCMRKSTLEKLGGARISQIIPKTKRNDSRCGKGGVPIPHYSDIIEERLKFSRNNLTEEQGVVFDYIMNNEDYRIVLLQAGPGCGKSFIMQSLCHTIIQQVGIIPYVVILKRDLLQEFKYCASGYTVCQFFMALFSLKMNELTLLEKFVATNFSTELFFNVANYLLQCSHLRMNDNLRAIKFMILDEYTMVPNLLLYTLLQFTLYHNIRLVVCGDKNQLQCIGTSRHARVFGAFDIVSAFSDRVFTLHANQRCSDIDYNEKLGLLGQLSSSKRVQPQGYAIIAAMCPDKLSGEISVNDTIIGSEHREISDTVHRTFINHYQKTIGRLDSQEFGEELWYIHCDDSTDPRLKGVPVNQHDNIFIPFTTQRYLDAHRRRALSAITATSLEDDTNNDCTPGKYLPYLPLIVGQRYFLNVFSETSKCRLKRINRNDANNVKIDTLTVERLDSADKSIDIVTVIGRVKCDECMFDGHRQYIINGGENPEEYGVGHCYNFPLYPAFYMTAHMSQGRTIRSRISILLSRSSYSGMYVAMSRVSTTDSINVIEIPNKMQYMLSHVMNFKGRVPQMAEIERVIFEEGYKLYKMNENPMDPSLVKFNFLIKSICNGVMCENPMQEYPLTDNDRTQLYHIVASIVSTWPVTILPPLYQVMADENENNRMNESMGLLVNNKTTFRMMGRLSSWDARAFIRVLIEVESTKEHSNLNQTKGVPMCIAIHESNRYSYAFRHLNVDPAVLSGNISDLDEFLTSLVKLYKKSNFISEYKCTLSEQTTLNDKKPHYMNALTIHTMLFAQVLLEYKRRVIDDHDADESRFYQTLYKHEVSNSDVERATLFDAKKWYDDLVADPDVPFKCECSSRTQLIALYEKEFVRKESGLINRLLSVRAKIMGNCTNAKCICGWRTCALDESQIQSQQKINLDVYIKRLASETSGGETSVGNDNNSTMFNYLTDGVVIKSRRLN